MQDFLFNLRLVKFIMMVPLSGEIDVYLDTTLSEINLVRVNIYTASCMTSLQLNSSELISVAITRYVLS